MRATYTQAANSSHLDVGRLRACAHNLAAAISSPAGRPATSSLLCSTISGNNNNHDDDE